MARADELVVEEFGDDLLVYDLKRDRAHSLGATATRVWRACDGHRSADEIASHLELDASLVSRALDELRDCSLLDGEAPAAPNGGMTRRDLTVRAAKVGVAASAVPLIVSIAAPVPAAASTPTPAQCMLYTDRDCDNCTNICGCCCCGQGGTGVPSCKLCYTIAGCSDFVDPNGADDYKCSTKAKDPPDCDEPSDTYDCKSTGSVPPKTVEIDDTERCCTYVVVAP